MYIPKEVGVRCRERRLNIGMTQYDLADASGIDRSQISRLERGSKGVSVEGVIGIARTLGVSTDWLLLGTGVVGKKPESEDQEVGGKTTDEQLLLDCWRAMSPTEQNNIAWMISRVHETSGGHASFSTALGNRQRRARR